jgi:hypothetical protein
MNINNAVPVEYFLNAGVRHGCVRLISTHTNRAMRRHPLRTPDKPCYVAKRKAAKAARAARRIGR